MKPSCEAFMTGFEFGKKKCAYILRKARDQKKCAYIPRKARMNNYAQN